MKLRPVPILLAALALMLLAAPAASAKSKIRSVAFKGTIVRPTIVVIGTGFGKRPKRKLAKSATCTSKARDIGYDYGTNLWLEVTPPGGALWAAGRSKGKAVDCIGLVAVSWSKTRVTFRLGKIYLESGVDLTAGSEYRVGVRGARKAGRLRYS